MPKEKISLSLEFVSMEILDKFKAGALSKRLVPYTILLDLV